ncbi:MAG: multicopper oxidase family protein [Methylocystis sp.]
MSRRGFILGAGAAAIGTSAHGYGQGHTMRRIAPNRASEAFDPDVDLELICKRDETSILTGRPTRVWRYAGHLIKGPANALTETPGAYLGPLLRFSKGQKVRIRLRNELPEETITHWHGLHVPMLMDGHPTAAIDPGETYVYEFDIRNRAGMYFYHPHTHEKTATQVYRGLAGAIIVEDEEERALALPSGAFEIPLVIQDRSFDDDNQLAYGDDMPTRMFGFYGDRALVNGRCNVTLDVASRPYRLRILNGSNARIYKLCWDDRTPLTVIGVDGGLLEKAETRPYVMLAPAERVDLIVDFTGRPQGSKRTMLSGEFYGLLPPMAQRMMGRDLPMGEAFPLFAARVTETSSDSWKAPEKLSTIRRFREADIANLDNPIPIAITMAHMAMLLNGRPYGHDDIQPCERIPVDSTQLIEIFHERGGMGQGMGMGMMGGSGMMRGRMGGMGMGRGMGMMGMMSMAHPIHLHGQPFEIIERSFAGDDDAYATISEGFIDSGLKDTVLVAPGERLRIVKPFGDFKGRFMYHCHNLEHEDAGMMREFSVE